MLSQANKAREAGAQSQLGAINRAQQAYRLENTVFASNSADLGLGDATAIDTDDYNLELQAGTATASSATARPFDTASGMKCFNGAATQNAGVTDASVTEVACP